MQKDIVFFMYIDFSLSCSIEKSEHFFKIIIKKTAILVSEKQMYWLLWGYLYLYVLLYNYNINMNINKIVVEKYSNNWIHIYCKYAR